MVSVGGGLGGSFYGDSGGSLSFGVGGEYFVWHGIGAGLSFYNDFSFFSNSFKNAYPGIENKIPTYFGTLMPALRVFLFRSFRFSPYVRAGTGPVFLNNDQPTIGEWQAGGGFYIGFSRNFALDVGVGVAQFYTESGCDRALSATYTAATSPAVNPGQQVDVYAATCGVRVFPRIGLVFGFGGQKDGDRKSRKEKKEEEANEGWVPPAATPSEGESAPEFAPAEETAPAPSETETGWEAPAEPAPAPAPVEETPVEETPVEEVPPAESQPPAESPAEPSVEGPVEEPGAESAPPVQSPSSLPN